MTTGPPRKIDVDKIMAGLDPDIWRTSAEVASKVGVSTARATWILHAMGNRVESKEMKRQNGSEYQTRSLWRLTK
jgi:hypothetical protein